MLVEGQLAIEKFSTKVERLVRRLAAPRHENVQKSVFCGVMMSRLPLIRRNGCRASSKALDKSFGESAMPD
jgi:hypothetical protein